MIYTGLFLFIVNYETTNLCSDWKQISDCLGALRGWSWKDTGNLSRVVEGLVVRPCMTWDWMKWCGLAGPSMLLPLGERFISIMGIVLIPYVSTASFSGVLGSYCACKSWTDQLSCDGFYMNLGSTSHILLSQVSHLDSVHWHLKVRWDCPLLIRWIWICCRKKCNLNLTPYSFFCFFKILFSAFIPDFGCFLMSNICTYTQNKNECLEQTRNFKDFLDSVLIS